jgi:urease accessory protein
MVALSPSPDWLVWQLIDSAFPSGGFAHSGGLEAAWQLGFIRTRTELREWIEASLHQLGSAAVPFVTTAHDPSQSLEELDAHCDAFLSNHVANRASRLQGQAFLSSARRIFNLPLSRPSCGHLAPVFGRISSALRFDLATAVQVFLFLQLRGMTGSAVRLGIVGPMEAQALQQQLSPLADQVLQKSLKLDLSDIAQTAPILDLWQGSHDRLYSRLFQS